LDFLNIRYNMLSNIPRPVSHERDVSAAHRETTIRGDARPEPHSEQASSGIRDRAALRSVAAPVAPLLDDLAAEHGGWWTGRTVGDALSRYTTDDDTYYRAHFAHYIDAGDGDLFEATRPAYILGHLAGFNPEYIGQPWREVEQALAAAWCRRSRADWGAVSDVVRAAFNRVSMPEYQAWRTRLADAAPGGDYLT
jgi:hypothetical protein